MQINRSVRPEIMDSVALLVLDAQDCFIETLSQRDDFLKRCAFAIEAARIMKIHTLFTEQVPEKLGRANELLLKLARNAKTFSKQTFSALGAPGLERYLRDKEIYHLLVVGLETPICIYQTGLQATEEDIDITFLSDALGSRRKEDHSAALEGLRRLGCQVLPSETVFYSLIGEVNSIYFRDFNQIVKTFNEADFDLSAYCADRQKQREEKDGRPQKKTKKDTATGRQSSEGPKEAAQGERKDDDDDERKARRRGRRRRGGRNRSREEQTVAVATESSPPSESASDSTQAEPLKAPAREIANEATEAPVKKRPAKKAAKKAASKTAKKAATKAVKKTARKTAKKAASDSDHA